MIKLDMGRAWSDTVDMIKEHGLKILGMFLVFAVLMIAVGALLFGSTFAALSSASASGNPAVMTDMMAGGLGMIFLMYIVLGALALAAYFASWRLALSRGSDNFGGALVYGLKASLPSLLAIIVIYIVFVIILFLIMLPFGFAFQGIASGQSLGGAGAFVILSSLLMICLFLFLYARLGLSGPIMSARGSINPVQGLADSWKLTAGNSLRLMVYIFIVNLVLVVAFLLIAFLANALGQISSVITFVILLPVYAVSILVSISLPAGIFTALDGGNEFSQHDVESIFD